MTSATSIPRQEAEGGTSLLDTADVLVDRLDSLASILEDIENQYMQSNDEDDAENNPKSKPERTPRDNVFSRLKDGLESARSLIACLKREKWRLSRRKMSVELRLEEVEIYKTHLKEDMTSMNETVDILSKRIIELENSLCEAQEIQETLELEKAQLQERLSTVERSRDESETENLDLHTELRKLTLSRSNSKLQKEVVELESERDMLLEENHRLKDMIRHLEKENSPVSPNSSHDYNHVVDHNSNTPSGDQKRAQINEQIKSGELIEEYV